MAELDALRSDLAAEQRALDDIVSALSDEQWGLATSSPGWDVTDQVGHLTYFDGTAAMAITDPEGFSAGVAALFDAATTVGPDEFTLGAFRARTSAGRLQAWRANRQLLAAASATLAEDTRGIWYGPPMGAKSFLTARLMEVWAHGADVAEAVGASREATDRLRHIAQLGFITRGWSYAVRGETAPPGDVRLELTGPSGDVWAWGPADAPDSATGPAEDFCLVVTQRRHLDDTALEATGLARHWLLRAQAFAGGATDPPAPRRQ